MNHTNGITRSEFEQAMRDQNARRDAEVATARELGGACDTIEMLAFGGESYCRTHRVVGRCPYARLGMVEDAANARRSK